MLWGFFKKMVVADNAAQIADAVFSGRTERFGPELVVGAVFFAFQIYGDFSGYSDIAMGTAKLFGFRLMHNFRHPYFSRDIAEFWRRWHTAHRRPGHDHRLDPGPADLHSDHQPVHPERPEHQRSADRQGPDHRHRRPPPAAQPGLAYLAGPRARSGACRGRKRAVRPRDARGPGRSVPSSPKRILSEIRP
jgi:hypothetical protein